MSVRIKLVAIILFVALVPLVVSAFTALRIHSRAYEGKVADLHRATSHSGALWVSERLDAMRRSVAGVASSIPWASATLEEREGALWLVFQQSHDVAIASLFDAQRESIGRSAFIDGLPDDVKFAGHPRANVDVLAQFYRAVPFDGTATSQVAVGEVFAGAEGVPLLPIAIAVGERGEWTVAVALSLARMCDQARLLGGARNELIVIEPAGRRVCGPAGPAGLAAVDPVLAKSGPALVEYRDERGRALTASIAPTSDGWRVVAQQIASEATAAGERMRLQTLFWIAVAAVAALTAGMFLARAISRPVRELARGARELAGGNLGYRVSVTSGDELGGLALAFNRMSEDIAERNAEIEAFNAELQERVEERTRQLRDAQQQLLRSQKLAAVSSLAAGVAHEINNPLTGVLGIAQLLKAQASDDDSGRKRAVLLGQVETEAKRIRDIVQSMLSLSEEEAGEGFIELNLSTVVAEALRVVAGQISSAGIALVRDFPDQLPRIRGNGAQLMQLFAHLLNNAINAMKRPGTLTVSIRAVDGELVQAKISDTGHGIPPEHLERVFEPFFTTKEEWQGRGLGLAVAYRIVEQHNGKISINSEVDVGTTVTLTIPIARGGAHLV